MIAKLSTRSPPTYPKTYIFQLFIPRTIPRKNPAKRFFDCNGETSGATVLGWKRAFGSEGHKSPEGLRRKGRAGRGPSGPRNGRPGSPGTEGFRRRQERSSERVAGPRVQAPGVSTLFGPPTFEAARRSRPGIRAGKRPAASPRRAFPSGHFEPASLHLADACMAAVKPPVNDIWLFVDAHIQYLARFPTGREPVRPARPGDLRQPTASGTAPASRCRAQKRRPGNRRFPGQSNREASRLGDVGSEDPTGRKDPPGLIGDTAAATQEACPAVAPTGESKMWSLARDFYGEIHNPAMH